jgi:hypothetical protein
LARNCASAAATASASCSTRLSWVNNRSSAAIGCFGVRLQRFALQRRVTNRKRVKHTAARKGQTGAVDAAAG